MAQTHFSAFCRHPVRFKALSECQTKACAAEVEQLEKRTVNPSHRIVVSLLVCGKEFFCSPQLLNLSYPTGYDLRIETSEKYNSPSVIKVGSQERGVQRHQPLGIHFSPPGICIFKF